MLTDCHFKYDYYSGNHEPKEFFTEALIESKSFDLGLGFFSSSAINSLANGFALFIAQGGKMRVIINDVLTDSDKQAISQGQQEEVEDALCKRIIKDIEKMKETFSRSNELFFRCFSYLVSIGRMEFIATLSSKGGMTHDKYGIFTDEVGNEVAFIGSVNFTRTALEQNAECLTTFTSWEDASRVENYRKKFDECWSEDNVHLIRIPIEKVKTYIVDNYSNNNIQRLLEESISLRESTKKEHPLPTYLIEKLERKEVEPRFPFPQEREIQIKANNEWKKNGRNGIFAMATGSGKTVTALNCLLHFYREFGYYKALIVVPTQALALQWESEVKNFNFQNVISTHTDKDWKESLSRYSTRSLLKPNRNIVVITTYATFIRKHIQDFVSKTNGMDSFVLIADEVHNMGATGPLKHLPKQIKNRIGLSATPERVYDEGGSKDIYAFFNSYPPYYTYRFTMKEAIDSKILCPYEYYPVFVNLTREEMYQYNVKTEQLRKFIDPETGKYKKEAEMLLMARKRIVHKAAMKKQKVAALLDEHKAKGKLNYTFVFVPEGYEPNYAEIDNAEIDPEDIHIIDEYAQMFKKRKYSYHQYISGLDDAPSILDAFERGDIQILLSMKCLDEGVDIPRAQYAIFISSTGNPRQFIQRRGRVLRSCKGKDKAYIWDMIVLPPDIEKTASQTDINLFTGELKRVLNFAALADNKMEILYGELREICSTLNVDMFKMLEDEEEQYKPKEQ